MQYKHRWGVLQVTLQTVLPQDPRARVRVEEAGISMLVGVERSGVLCRRGGATRGGGAMALHSNMVMGLWVDGHVCSEMDGWMDG